jgi:hypothetical protein
VKHPIYKKYVRKFTTYKAHDEHDQAHEGDRVEIQEARPISKSKRWRLVRVVEAGNAAVRVPVAPEVSADVAPELAAEPDSDSPRGDSDSAEN